MRGAFDGPPYNQVEVRPRRTPGEHHDRRLLVPVAVRVFAQGGFDGHTLHARGCPEDLCDAEIVRIHHDCVGARSSRDRRRRAVGILGPEHDRAFERRQRSGVAVDRGNRLAEHAVENAAASEQAARHVRERGQGDAPRTGAVDDQLHRLRLIDRRERTRAARKRVGEPARPDRFGPLFPP